MGTSVVILTLNEEVNLPDCLTSLNWCDDVVVFDSYSSDGTVHVANAAGARVVLRQFDNYAAQRNAALQDVVYKYPWVLMVDADERVTPELAEEIRNTLSNEQPRVTLYRLKRKDMFMGRWIKRSSGYPTWFGRLIKVGHVTVEREINEEYHTDGKVGYLREHLIHYPFSKGFAEWFVKHNKYSTMEASIMNNGSRPIGGLCGMLNRDPAIRRETIKAVVYRMPARPLLMFVALYFLRGGFLDGRAGLTYCVLRSFYEFMIDCKVVEGNLRRKNLPL